MAFHFNRPLSELDMSMTDFNQAIAYLSINPPDDAANNRTASLMAHIANCSGKSLPKGKYMDASDYFHKPEPQRQTTAEQIAFMRSLKG